MDDTLLVRFVNGRANLLEDIDHPIKRQTILFDQHVAQRAAVEILHHQVRNAIRFISRESKVGHVDHIRMAQTSGGACLALEALDELLVLHELRRNEFQRDVTVGAEVRRQKHRAHTALSQQTLEAILLVQNLTNVTFEVIHELPATKRHKKHKEKNLTAGGPATGFEASRPHLFCLCFLCLFVAALYQSQYCSCQCRLRNCSSVQKPFINSIRDWLSSGLATTVS